jgi:hypothetical protein
MCAKSTQPDPRERAIARLAAEALQPHLSSGSGGEDCPEAGLVAAYADHGLADSERSQLEAHFAGCDRCQHLLAALGTILEASAGNSAEAAPVPAAAPANSPHEVQRPAPAPQRWLWWLTPVFGAAAAALLWMMLRPAAPKPVQIAANYPASAEQETKAMQAPAQAPASPEAPAAKARRDEQSLDRLSKADSSSNEIAAESRRQAVDQFATPTANSAPVPPPVPPNQAPQAGPAPATAARNQAAAAGTFGGAPSAPPNELQAGARAVAQIDSYTFMSPDGSVRWRLGAAGNIEKSSDRGQTWQQQSSGVTVDLLAGSASSNEAAWVVGRTAVILRTTNGMQWQRIEPPAGATGDWATVVARSATSATVVGANLRRFSTEDGGRTWVQQQ